ncbi:MAG TPA: thiamine-phosphate kinase [candidate division WOR-3 bacterium]|uniref:Thiamine-monophosphate kinase n=1 Tax=candidate division WOR-3 bacterium TaxID=2052148 RepID=A0A9C9K0E2_UNCW3|nr:thiamine-phosphate kinase [candidate division WOR-3 bacterium]
MKKRRDRRGGELAIIDFIRKRFPTTRREIAKGIGDDAMVLRSGFVVTTDSFFEGVHFDLEYFSMYALGYHTLCASLSDIAAMAGSPVCALISLNLPETIKLQEIEELYDGFQKVARNYRFDIAGGDVVTSPCFGLTIAVIGKTRTPVLRCGARPGQALYVTNFLGLAEVGRLVLKEKMVRKDYPHSIKRHLFPEPRIKEAQRLRRFISACIDTSDGLSTDALHLAEESRVKIVIDAEYIPIHSELGEFCNIKKIDPLRFLLSSGEDFELLFTASRPPKVPGLKIFKIGRVMKGRGLYLSVRGKTKPLEPTGYEHLV